MVISDFILVPSVFLPLLALKAIHEVLIIFAPKSIKSLSPRALCIHHVFTALKLTPPRRIKLQLTSCSMTNHNLLLHMYVQLLNSDKPCYVQFRTLYVLFTLISKGSTFMTYQISWNHVKNEFILLKLCVQSC